MSEPRPPDKVPLTVLLSPDAAIRLKMFAEAQKRPAVELAAELIERHLPRPQTGGPKKKIPYT